MSNIDEEEQKLREEALAKFFKEEKFTQKRVYELMKRLADYVTINREGEVCIENEEMPDKIKVAFVAAARYLGNLEDENISKEVSIKEVAEFVGIGENIARAYLSQLVDEGILKRPSRGKYEIRSLSTIEKLLRELQEQ